MHVNIKKELICYWVFVASSLWMRHKFVTCASGGMLSPVKMIIIIPPDYNNYNQEQQFY